MFLELSRTQDNLTYSYLLNYYYTKYLFSIGWNWEYDQSSTLASREKNREYINKDNN